MTRNVDEGRSRLVGFRAGIAHAAGFAVGFGEVLLQKHLPEKFADKLYLFFETEFGSTVFSDKLVSYLDIVNHKIFLWKDYIMSRNKINIKMQLNKLLDEKLRIGVKKTDSNRDTRNGYNSARYEGIHSIKTADTYRRTINTFGDFCKSIGLKDAKQITEDTVRQFVDSRRSNSSWTHSKDLAAINKVLGTSYTPSQFGIEQRKQENVAHNRRILTANSTAGASRNQEALWFVSVAGARRESFEQLKPSHAIRDMNGTVIGFHLIEKGGKPRNALVLPTAREAVTAFVDKNISEVGEDGQLIKPCDSNANPHYQRAEYAKEMYAQMVDHQSRGMDIYAG